MRIKLLCIGKTDNEMYRQEMDYYIRRLPNYVQFTLRYLPDLKNRKNLSEEQQKEQEAQMLFKEIGERDLLVLLDEKGKQRRSVDFARWLDEQAPKGQQLVFVVGGPYGFSQEIYARATFKIALSSMTFTHQMVRLIFIEQLYRAFSILQNKPYHHE